MFVSQWKKQIPAIWIREGKDTFPKGIIVVAGFCYDGKLKTKKVSSKSKFILLSTKKFRVHFLRRTYVLYVLDIKNV